MLQGKRILIGATACRNIYIVTELAALLMEKGADVEILLTPNATKLVSPLLLRNVTKNPVVWDTFATPPSSEVREGSTGEDADFLLVAPCSANMLGKAANGIADDLLSTTILSVDCPVALCLQMSPSMLQKPVIQSNKKRVLENGYLLLETEAGPVEDCKEMVSFIEKHISH